ncbi:MAG: primase, partial [Solirubrobacterales bacterium]|nr:primase [Solirubrobacterales bacterium]
MARYTPDSKEKVRDAVDFLGLVGQYSDLRKAGPASYKGLCPFHEERTPSFNINADEKFFKCFGCGEGGDVFSFVQKKEGLDFIGSLEYLAERFGVELELEDEDPAAARRRLQQSRLTELLRRTADFYVRNLWESREAAGARAYLAERGLDEQLLREFRVGYAPRKWDAVLIPSRRAGYTEQELLDAGLVIRSQKGGAPYDRFRARITFPLCDRKGHVMGFGARRLAEDDKGPKYLNSNDGPVFHKGKNVYASDIARVHATKAGTVILAEGYTDVIALHQAGLRNTVGLMGTSLTADQVTELARLAPAVLLALDADSAGQEAMLRAARVAAGRKLQLRVVPLPTGLDPADLVQEQGPEAMRELVAASVPFVTFRVQRALDSADLRSAEGKDAAIDLLRPVFADIPPSALREELVRTVADRTDLAPTLVASWLAGPQRSTPADRPPQRRPAPAQPAAPAAR